MPASLPHRVDVAIIGAGLAGAATAWALAARGVTDVVVLEREAAPGHHASGKNAGLARQLVDDDAGSAMATAGVAWMQAAGRSHARFVQTGSLLTFDDDAGAALYRARAARLGVEVRPATTTDLRRRWPHLAAPERVVGLEVPGDGVFEPGALLAGYLRDVPVVCGAAVDGIDVRGSDDIAVHTAAGTVHARRVVIAAGAWGTPVARALGVTPPTLTPIKRHAAIVAATVPAATAFVWHVGQHQAYARPHADGVLVSACDARVAEPDDLAIDRAGSADRHARLVRWAPSLASAPAVRAWACLRTFGPGNQPFIERDVDHAWLTWVVGLGGHGATGSVVIGQRAAALLA